MRHSKAIKRFIDDYSGLGAFNALQNLFSSSVWEADLLVGSHPLDYFILNYADSLLNAPPLFAYDLNRELQKRLKSQVTGDYDSFLRALSTDSVVINMLACDSHTIQRSLRQEGNAYWKVWLKYCEIDVQGGIPSDELIAGVMHFYKGMDEISLRRLFFFRRVINWFRKKRPSFFSVLEHEVKPCFPLTFPIGISEENRVKKALLSRGSSTPLIFMEAMQFDWKAILEPIKRKPAIFLFSTLWQLYHCLQFPALLETLLEREHLFFILSDDLVAQRKCQPFFRQLKPPLEPVLISKFPILTHCYKRITKSFEESLLLDSSLWNKDTKCVEELLSLGCTLHYKQLYHRFGKSKEIALQASLFSMNAFSQPLFEKQKGTALECDFLKRSLEEIGAKKIKKRSFVKDRPVIAHVVNQLVDGGHAPTRVLKAILQYHDKKKLIPLLFSTEQYILRLDEYPSFYYRSLSSFKRAPKLLSDLRKSEIEVDIEEESGGYLLAAERLVEKISQKNVDIAVFHGWGVINILAANLMDAPFSVFVDYGYPLTQQGFDLVINSAEESSERASRDLKAFNSRVVTLPMVVDVKEQWEAKAYPKSSFSLPEDAQMITTISNSLQSRLSADMCWAIANILKRCPKAYYCPIGKMKYEGELVRACRMEGVEERLHLLQQCAVPSQIARSMDLYLNEFPVGGGFALLDAMAAGLPIVTMFDENGPIQGRVGGIYYSKERALSSCDREEYMELACELLKNQALQKEHSLFSLNRYNELADPKRYVRKLEQLILNHAQAFAFPEEQAKEFVY